MEVLRRFAHREIPDEWEPTRDSWLVACLVESRLAEEFWLRDDSPRGLTDATYTQYVFARVTDEERKRREGLRGQGWNETPIERERWLRDRRQRKPMQDVLAIYVCEIASFAACVVLGPPEAIDGVAKLVEIAVAELREAGWQVIDRTVYEKRVPAELGVGGQRVFDVVFACPQR